ncbi:class I SAM-dependent methyltransferase [Pontiella sp.]|uniref:class I SAM-dependent methyltransferase n=1 Tax=Pontiella sp. TaxID=2837462 RepID=UPI003562269E
MLDETEDSIEFYIDGSAYLVEEACRLPFESVLDVGFGNGAASFFFRDRGKDVIAVDRDVGFRGAPVERMKSRGIRVVESEFETLVLDKAVDAIWISHVLEHTLDVGRFLKKAHDLLKADGWLFIMVPPFKHEVVGGHVTPGWNIGILMYVLLVSGFDIKNGHFIRHGYNICGFVRKSSIPLPALCFDQGDIERTREFWPMEVFQGFDGNLKSVNWIEQNETQP